MFAPPAGDLEHVSRHPLLPLASLGFLAQVSQVALLREVLSAFQGTELVLGIVLGTWTLSVALGGLLGGLPRRRPDVWMAAVGLLLLCAPSVSLWGVRQIRAVFPASPGELLPLSTCLLASPLFLGPTGLLVGASFPLGARWFAECGARHAAARAYRVEALGSVAGGALASLLLVPWLGHFQLAAVGAFAHAAALAVVPETRSLFVVGAFATMALAWTDPFEAGSAQAMWARFLPGFRLEETRHARHGEVAVLSYRGQANVYLGGHLVASLPDRGEAAPLATLALLQVESPRRVLLLEGATSGLPKTLLQGGVAELTLVDSEPAVLEAARAHMAREDLAAIEDPRTRRATDDPRRALRAAAGRHDIVLILPSDPLTLAVDRFYTVEFFREARSALAPGGVLVFGGLSGGGAYLGDEVLERNASIYAAAREVFGRVLVTPGSTWFYFAGDAVTLDEDELVARLTTRGLPIVDIFGLVERNATARLNEVLAAAVAGRPRPAGIGGKEEPFPPLDLANSDARPASCYQSLRLWDKALRGEVTRLLPRADRFPRAWFWGWAALCALAIPFARRRSHASALSVFGAGFASMGFTVVVLLSFQCAEGDLAQGIGGLLSSFMLGLFVGSRGGESRAWMAPLLVTALCLSAPWVLSLGGGFATHAALLVASGALTGRAWAAAVAQRLSASAAYAIDLVGAALAAAIVGSHLLPLWGRGWTCAALAAPSMAALTASVTACKQR